jgi:hypothetical protein
MARIFLAGASAVIGQRLIPLLVQPVEGIVAQPALSAVPATRQMAAGVIAAAGRASLRAPKRVVR